MKFGRTLFIGLVTSIIVLAMFGDLRGVYDAHIAAQLAEERSKIVLQLNESTLARFAKHKADTDSLTGAVEAAGILNGKLVAALAIRTKPDTVYVPIESVVTITDSTGTRTASLTDTTDMGIQVKVDAVAPPFPADLKLGLKIIVPEFRPEIAFIENDEGIFASVTWANQNFQVEAPFFKPQPLSRKPLRINVGTSLLLHSNINQPTYANVFGEFEYTTPIWVFSVPVGFDNFGTYMGFGIKRNIAEWTSVLDMLWPF